MAKDIINILQSWPWTAVLPNSPLRDKAPYILARQYKLVPGTFRSLINAVGSVLGGVIQEGLTSLEGVFSGLASDSIIREGISTLQTLTKTGEYGIDGYNAMQVPSHIKLPDALKIYAKLYTVEKDVKTYIMPYFAKEHGAAISNSFSDSYTGNTITGSEILINDIIPTVLKNAAVLRNISQGIAKDGAMGILLGPGTYIEMPKYYDFAQSGTPSITVNFTLYNTIDTGDYTDGGNKQLSIYKNLEFIDNFIKENQPVRNDLISYEPPRIYALTVPGTFNIPWAYVSNFSAQFGGYVQHVKLQDREIAIPEFYNVSITFTSLVKQTEAFYAPNNKISIDV